MEIYKWFLTIKKHQYFLIDQILSRKAVEFYYISGRGEAQFKESNDNIIYNYAGITDKDIADSLYLQENMVVSQENDEIRKSNGSNPKGQTVSDEEALAAVETLIKYLKQNEFPIEDINFLLNLKERILREFLNRE